MSWLTALGLCVAGLAAIIIEFFVPAAGIIGVLGFASMVGGIVVAYSQYGTVIGSVYLIASVVVTPIVIALYFRIFPKSAVGRWLILGGQGGAKNRDNDGEGASADDGSPAPILSRYSVLVGKTGTTVSSLRPAGTARIEGMKYSVVTGGEFVDTGREVIVTRVRGNRIHVKEIAG